MIRRHELTDRAWEQVWPLLPPDRGGRPARDPRVLINAILWKLATGAPWRDLPERYGPWQTAYHRFRQWSRDGTWERLWRQVQVKSDAVGQVDWEIVAVDSTMVRAHQHAAGARKRGGFGSGG